MRIAKSMAAVATLAGASLISFGSEAAQQAFYRAYSGSGGDHFYTTSLSELVSAGAAGYAYEGVACNLLTADDALAAGPFYRAFSPAQVDHFYTASVDELINAVSFLGYTYEGVAGYLAREGNDFYRSYSGAQGDHFYTANYQEWINSAISFGYTLEGSAGKVR